MLMDIEPPAQLVDQPRDRRGYIAPAEAPWKNGLAVVSRLDIFRKVALGFARACGVCGFVLQDNWAVYRVFSQRDAALSRLNGAEVDFDEGPPGHLSCMLYAAFACPYWQTRDAALSKGSLIAPGAPRGTRPALIGYADAALALPERGGDMFDQTAGGIPQLFAYVKLVADIPFRDPQELLELYRDAPVGEVDTTGRRYYWTDSPADVAQLMTLLREGTARMNHRSAERRVVLNGERRVLLRTPI